MKVADRKALKELLQEKSYSELLDAVDVVIDLARRRIIQHPEEGRREREEKHEANGAANGAFATSLRSSAVR